jgi:peptide/nickel transport system permease protein
MDPHGGLCENRHLARAALVGLGVGVVAFVVYALVIDPSELDLALLGPAPPSISHPFGTDSIGRDQLSIVLHGLGLTAAFALPVAAIWTLLGLIGGAVARRGWVRRSSVSTSVTLSILVALGLAATSVPLVIRLSYDSLGWPSPPMWWLALPWRFGMDPAWAVALMLVGAAAIGLLAYAMNLAYRADRATARLRTLVTSLLVAVSAGVLLELYVAGLGFGFQPPSQSLGQNLFECRHRECWIDYWWIGACAALPAITAVVIPLAIAMRQHSRHTESSVLTSAATRSDPAETRVGFRLGPRSRR